MKKKKFGDFCRPHYYKVVCENIQKKTQSFLTTTEKNRMTLYELFVLRIDQHFSIQLNFKRNGNIWLE